MSHPAPAPSAPGTPLADQHVGEIVAGNPNLSRVFQAFGLGFCCQGKLSLRQACERNKVDLDQVLAALRREAGDRPAPTEDPKELTLSELAGYIVEHHHGFLRRELPRIHAMAERVAQVHGERRPALVELFQAFTQFGKKLAWLAKNEEEALFPAIRRLDANGGRESEITSAQAEVESERRTAIAAIARLRGLTDGYRPPADACNTYRALFAGLAELESDTLRHFGLEDEILFQRASQMAS